MESWLDFDRFAVFGLGRSGVAAANLLAAREKSVLASDTRTLDALEDAAELDERVQLVAGENAVGDAEVVVVSPGLRPRLDVFRELAERKIPVISEIELAYAAAQAPILAITGTDGKSTTTVLTAHILDKSGVAYAVGGNLGTPLCALVDQVSSEGYIVAEVSAFQLWTTSHFSPAAFGLTNIAFDHLDYFDTYDEYVEAKRQVMKNADSKTLGVFNLEDRYIQRWHADFAGRSVGYGLSEAAVEDVDDALWLDGDGLSARIDGVETRGWIPDTATLPISGPHNMLNLMCAAGLAHSVGVGLEQVRAAVADFEPLPHRLEFVGEAGGVRFFDDSKATNVHAALAGLKSLGGGLVAIIGGVDKGLDLGDLIDFLNEREAKVVLIGEIRERLGSELLATGYPSRDIRGAESMQAAVEQAFDLASSGDTVSLSPACSSFDMFDSYAHRGDVFQAAVRALSAK